LIELHPESVLDSLAEKSVWDSIDYRLGGDEVEGLAEQINNIGDDILLNWCQINGELGLKFVSNYLIFFRKSKVGKIEWRPIFWQLLNIAADLDSFLEMIGESLLPNSWSGSLAEILESRVTLLGELVSYQNGKVSSWAISTLQQLRQRIAKAREHEAQSKVYSGSFE
jgi:hypothetical protein